MDGVKQDDILVLFVFGDQTTKETNDLVCPIVLGLIMDAHNDLD